MLRSDYCSDYERQKSEFQNSIATIVATTSFKNRFEWPKQREGIYKEKKIEISLLSRPAEKRGIRLSPPRGKSASIAFWYQNAACREDPDPNMPPAGGGRTRRAGKGLADQRPAAVGVPAQADPRRKHPSRTLRRTSQSAHGNPPDRQQYQSARPKSERRVCKP